MLKDSDLQIKNADRSPILARRRLKSDHLVLNMPGNFNLVDSKKFSRECESEHFNSTALDISKHSPLSRNNEMKELIEPSSEKKQRENRKISISQEKNNFNESIKSFDFPPGLKLKKIESEQYDLKDVKWERNPKNSIDDSSVDIVPIKEEDSNLLILHKLNSFGNTKNYVETGIQCDLIKNIYSFTNFPAER